MIDVRIGSGSVPQLRIVPEVFRHVLVDFLLKIDAEFAQATNDDIRSCSFARGDVAIGIGYAVVEGIVIDLLPGMGEGRSGQSLAGIRGILQRGNQNLRLFHRDSLLSRLEKRNQGTAKPTGDAH